MKIGYLGAMIGGRPPRPGQRAKVGEFTTAAEIGFTAEQRDLPDISAKDFDIQLAYQMRVLKAAEAAGIYTHLLGIICDPAWAYANKKLYAKRMNRIIELHDGLDVSFMIGREMIQIAPKDYADWLKFNDKMIPLNVPVVFTCVPRLEESATWDWVKEAMIEEFFYDYFAINWHGDAGKHLDQLPDVIKRIKPIVGNVLVIAETGTWGSANTVQPPQTDEQQGAAMCKLIKIGRKMGVKELYFCPALQDSESVAGKDFGGQGLVDVNGKLKVGAEMVKKEIAKR